MYLLLDENGQERIRRNRLLTLEGEHYSIVLQLGEMDAAGLPTDAPGRLAALADLHAIETAINWHRGQIEPTPRVGPGGEPASGDDGPEEKPLGEEATT